MRTIEWGKAIWALSRSLYRGADSYVQTLIRLYAYFGLKEKKDGVDQQNLLNLRAEMRNVIDRLPVWARVPFDREASKRYYDEFWMKSSWRGITSQELLEFVLHLALRKVEGMFLPKWSDVSKLFKRLRSVDRDAELEAILWLERIYGRRFVELSESASLEKIVLGE